MPLTKQKQNPNKHAVITIMIKQLLAGLRPRYPGARLLAFPENHGVGVRVSFKSVEGRTADINIWQANHQRTGFLYLANTKRRASGHGRLLGGLANTGREAFLAKLRDVADMAKSCSAIDSRFGAECSEAVLEKLLPRAYDIRTRGMLFFDLEEPDCCEVVELWIQMNVDDLLLMK